MLTFQNRRVGSWKLSDHVIHVGETQNLCRRVFYHVKTLIFIAIFLYNCCGLWQETIPEDVISKALSILIGSSA